MLQLVPNYYVIYVNGVVRNDTQYITYFAVSARSATERRVTHIPHTSHTWCGPESRRSGRGVQL